MVSIILANYNGAGLLTKCLSSVFDLTRGVSFEVIVVDNASTDESRDLIERDFPRTRLLVNSENAGFSRANNLGARNATGSELLFLNTDTFLLEDSVSILARYLEQHADVGVVGPRLVFEDGTFQLSAGRLPSVGAELVDKILHTADRHAHRTMAPLYRAMFSSARKVGWVTGACMMVRREAFERVGGFDERMFLFFEDKDLCKRVHDAGWNTHYTPEPTVVHLRGGSSASAEEEAVRRAYRESQLRYYRKHCGRPQTALVEAYLRLSGKL